MEPEGTPAVQKMNIRLLLYGAPIACAAAVLSMYLWGEEWGSLPGFFVAVAGAAVASSSFKPRSWLIGIILNACLVGGIFEVAKAIVTQLKGNAYLVTATDAVNAKAVVGKNLTTLGTAKWQTLDVLERKDDFRLVAVVVDAQNNFGALIRNKLCVIYKYEGGKMVWSKAYGISECTDPPTKDEIETAKRLNDWPDDVPDWVKKKKS